MRELRRACADYEFSCHEDTRSSMRAGTIYVHTQMINIIQKGVKCFGVGLLVAIFSPSKQPSEG